MALSVPELWAMRDALLKSRASGIREVRDQNNESVTYKGDSEMANAIASLDRQISAAALSGGSPKTIIFSTSKGLV